MTKVVIKPDPQNPNFETQKFRWRPQDEVPTERIVHYVVKDYRRMFEGFHALRQERDEAVAELEEAKKKRKNIEQHYQKQIEKLKEQLEDVRSSREQVVNAVTDDIRDELKQANRKVKSLVQALDDPSLLPRLDAVVGANDDEWKDKALKQLEKAMLNFTTIEGRLVTYQSLVEEAVRNGCDSETIDKVIPKFAKAFAKIDSCIDHIEDFFKKVGFQQKQEE